MTTPIHETDKAASVAAYFVTKPQNRTKWWHWIIGFALICLLSFLGMTGLFLASQNLLPTNNATIYLDLLIAFLPVFITIPLIYKFWHKRPIIALMTSSQAFRWDNMFRAGFVLIAFFGLASLLESIIFPDEYEGLKIQTDLKRYIPLLIITFVFVPFQAASEEFLCRGYLNQALVKYLRSPWIVFALTSAGFAALHAANPEAQGQMWPYLASIFTFGMAMCVLLYFEGGIESAIGAHIANNIFVFGFLGYEDPHLPNTAWMTLGAPKIGWWDFVLDFVMIAIVTALIIWANRRSAP